MIWEIPSMVWGALKQEQNQPLFSTFKIDCKKMTGLPKAVSISERASGDGSLAMLGAIFENREPLISALAALVDDLSDTKTKKQLTKLATELQMANSVEQLQGNQRILQWLPLLVSGFNQKSTKPRLSHLIFFASRDHEIRMGRRKALAYPVLLAAIVLLVFSLITILVVPPFDRMFADFGIELPESTKLLMSLSREVRFHPIRILSAVVTGIGFLLVLKKLWAYSGLSHRLFKRLINGNSASISDMSVLTSRLAELLQLGMSHSDAITLASFGLTSPWYQKICLKLADEIASNPDWEETKIARNFPGNMIHALTVQPSPNLELLRELSAIYAERVRHRMNWTTGAFAQISILALGLVVGFMVTVLLSPLVSLIAALS